MIPILLQRDSASSMLCVVKMTLHSLSVVVMRLMMSHINRRAIGSMPVVVVLIDRMVDWMILMSDVNGLFTVI